MSFHCSNKDKELMLQEQDDSKSTILNVLLLGSRKYYYDEENNIYDENMDGIIGKLIGFNKLKEPEIFYYPDNKPVPNKFIENGWIYFD